MKQLSALVMITLVIVVVLSSCAPVPRQVTPKAVVPAQEITVPTVSQPSSTPTTPVTQVTSLPSTVASTTGAVVYRKEPVLSSRLTCNCPSGPTTNQGFEKVGLNIGAKAIDFTLKDVYGEEYRLSRLLAEKPVMLVFGSFT